MYFYVFNTQIIFSDKKEVKAFPSNDLIIETFF